VKAEKRTSHIPRTLRRRLRRLRRLRLGDEEHEQVVPPDVVPTVREKGQRGIMEREREKGMEEERNREEV
jgi:hypothetical protein